MSILPSLFGDSWYQFSWARTIPFCHQSKNLEKSICVIIDDKGKELQFGYVCDLCKKEAENNPEEEINFEYIIQDDGVIPFLN
jgi:hypothetical protein